MIASLAFSVQIPLSPTEISSSSQKRFHVARSHRPSQALAPRPTRHSPVAPTCSARRRSENIEGNFFVDTSCIDCDTCRWFAPETFERRGSKSAVHCQPTTHEARLRAAGAAVACPTGSIRTEHSVDEAKEASRSLFPIALNEEQSDFYLGFTASATFAASSYLVIAKDTAVLVDCPRYSSMLAKRIDAIIEANIPGGRLDFIVLSHRDDVAGHDKWAERYPTAKRVIHELEVNRRQATDACEMKLTLGPDDVFQLAPGLEIIACPGHTRGHIALLHRDSKSLFSGDHLAWSSRTGGLTGFPRYNSYSWDVQVKSISKLGDLPWLHLYPGHGRMTHYESDEERRLAIATVTERMKVEEV